MEGLFTDNIAGAVCFVLPYMYVPVTRPGDIASSCVGPAATACLSKLGIDDCFDGVFCFESFLELAEHETAMRTEGQVVVCKPWPSTFKIACSRANVAPERALFLDDNARNTAGDSRSRAGCCSHM